MQKLLRPSLNWLLVFVPATIVLSFVSGAQATWIFVCACLAVIPLAGWMGKATEHLAERTSEGIGGLLNATFGNAAELIIAIVALKAGMIDIVKASLTGSIIGNVLLVLGASFLAGGLKYPEQKFNARGARIQATLMTLAAIGLVAPAVFHHSAGEEGLPLEGPMSVAIAIVLLVGYALGLVFSLRTHRHLFDAHVHPSDGKDEASGEGWSLKKSLLVLLAATAIIAWVSEILVHSVEEAAHTFGMSNIFVGVIVVAIIGNAAEHSTAVLVAVKNRMDLSLGIAIGSSIQIALFVAPLLVLLSYAIAPEPMSLVFTLPEVIAVALAVAIVFQISEDGESNWLEGFLLLAVYAILAIIFFYLPDTAH